MKIHTLGTSHGDSTPTRFNSCTAYETADGSLYLLDAGAPAEALLRRRGLSVLNLRAVFGTHIHDDHMGGMTSLLKQVLKYDRERTDPVEVYFPEEGAEEAFCGWLAALHIDGHDRRLRYHVTEDGTVYEDDRVTVGAVRTNHLKRDGQPVSFAYTLYFKAEGIRVLHTGDLSGAYTDFPAAAQREYFDVCVSEATHHKPEDAATILSYARLGRLIFTHIGDR